MGDRLRIWKEAAALEPKGSGSRSELTLTVTPLVRNSGLVHESNCCGQSQRKESVPCWIHRDPSVHGLWIHGQSQIQLAATWRVTRASRSPRRRPSSWRERRHPRKLELAVRMPWLKALPWRFRSIPPRYSCPLNSKYLPKMKEKLSSIHKMYSTGNFWIKYFKINNEIILSTLSKYDSKFL